MVSFNTVEYTTGSLIVFQCRCVKADVACVRTGGGATRWWAAHCGVGAYHSIHRRLNYERKLCDFLCMFVNTLEANDKNGPIVGNYMCLNIFLCRVDLSNLLCVFFFCYLISFFWVYRSSRVSLSLFLLCMSCPFVQYFLLFPCVPVTPAVSCP